MNLVQLLRQSNSQAFEELKNLASANDVSISALVNEAVLTFLLSQEKIKNSFLSQLYTVFSNAIDTEAALVHRQMGSPLHYSFDAVRKDVILADSWQRHVDLTNLK